MRVALVMSSFLALGGLSPRMARATTGESSEAHRGTESFVADDAAKSAATSASSQSPAAASANRESKSETARDEPDPQTFVGDHAGGYAQRALGVRSGLTRVGAGALLGDVSFYERGVGLLSGDWVSARYFDELWIGGGGGGVTYSLAMHLAIGIRRDVILEQGPFARFAVRGEMKRRGGVYSSSLRLPGLELGWGGTPGEWVYEILGHAGASVLGRLRSNQGVDDVFREHRGWVAGAAWSLGRGRIQSHGDVSHLFTGGVLAFDVRTDLCTLWGKKVPQRSLDSPTFQSSVTNGPGAMDYRWAVCADGALFTSERPSAPSFEQWSLGFSFVFGQFSRLDPPAKP